MEFKKTLAHGETKERHAALLAHRNAVKNEPKRVLQTDSIPVLVPCPCDFYQFAHYHSEEFKRISRMRFKAGGPPITKEEWQRYREDQF